jgi:hypothetical protein
MQQLILGIGNTNQWVIEPYFWNLSLELKTKEYSTKGNFKYD